MKERLQKDHEKEMQQNPKPKKLDDFKKKNINRTSPPRGYVESVLERLGETIDTSNMNGLGLSKRLGKMKDPSTMQIWKEVMEEYLAAISKNPNICTSAATPSQSSGSGMASTEQDEEEDMGDNHRIVTTTLRQIVRGEHSLADIENQLVSEQKDNHQVFEAFCNVIREATDMVRLTLL